MTIEQIISINGFQQKVIIGCTEKERHWPQILFFDLSMTLDASRAIENDNVEFTADYIFVMDLIKSICESRPFSLIEQLSHEICTQVLDQIPVVTKSYVKIRKNVSTQCEGVTCEYKMSRG